MENDAHDEKPPLFASWRQAHWLVVVVLAALIALFTVLSRIYE